MDPFKEEPDKKPDEEEGAPDAAGKDVKPAGKPDRRPPVRVKGSRRVTYSAAAAAIGTLCSVVAIYLPVKVMPLVVTAFCFYLVFERCGISYGFITEAVTLLLTFFVSGVVVNVTFVMLALVFVPYAPLAYLIRRLRYDSVKTVLLRAAIVAVFVSLAFMCVYFVVANVALEGLDIIGMINKVGGYWVIALLLIPIAVSIDFLFTQMAVLIRKMLK